VIRDLNFEYFLIVVLMSASTLEGQGKKRDQSIRSKVLADPPGR
jgi:hypothetical protein